MSEFYSFLLDIDIVSENPVTQYRKRHITPYKQSTEYRQLVTTKQIEDIINKTEYPYNVAALLLAKTGMRREELCSLDFNNLNLEKGMIIIKKDNNHKRSNRRAPIDEQTINILK